MKTRLIHGTPILLPATADELGEALASGEPFEATPELAQEFGLPRDPHLVDGEDAGVLDPEEAAA